MIAHQPEQIMATYVEIRNHPRWFGVPLDREPAQIRTAILFDSKLKASTMRTLKWEGDTPRQLTDSTVIESAASKRLYVFAKRPYSEEYFIFNPSSLDAPMPDRYKAYSDHRREFAIELRDQKGRRYRFAVEARNSEGDVQAVVEHSWRERLARFRQGMDIAREAFTFQRFD